MASLDDFDVEDLAYYGALALLGYVVINYVRDRMAESTPGTSFAPSPPQYPTIDADLDILSPMQISPAGAAQIQQREGLSLTVKNDAGHRMIGYGHDIQPGENISSSITRAQALQLLNNDLAGVASTLNGALTVPVTQDQFDALGSLVYNIGAPAFKSSTLLKLLNTGDYAGAAAQFASWNRSGGQVNQGLNNRRRGEQGQFNGTA